MVRNESVRFGRHIGIEVSYKSLQLEIPKLVLILHYLACFKKGLFGGNFEQKHHGVNPKHPRGPKWLFVDLGRLL
jgi:hypothetical protein